MQFGVPWLVHECLEEEIVACFGIQAPEETQQQAPLPYAVLLAVDVLQPSLGYTPSAPTAVHSASPDRFRDEVHATWGKALLDTIQDSSESAHLEEGLQLQTLLETANFMAC